MSVSDLQETLATRPATAVYVESIAMAFVFVFALVGNTLVFYAIWKSPHLRNRSNMFVFGLAVSDILMAVLCMPLSFLTLVHGKWMFGEKVCHFHGFSVFTLGLASLHMMALVSVNRYFCILKTAKYPRLFKPKRILFYIIVVWTNALTGSVPPIFFHEGGYSFQPGKAMCLYEFEANIPYTAFIEVVYIGSPLLLITFCYSSVFKTVYNTNKMFSVNEASPDELRAHVKESKVTKTLAAVFLGFASCWLPISVIDYIDAVNGLPVLPRHAYLTYGFLVYLSSAINPIVYGIASRSFRREYKKFFMNVCWKPFCCYKTN